MQTFKRLRRAQNPFFQWQSWATIGVFALIGSSLFIFGRAAVGTCSTTNTVGSATHTISVPATGSYKLWVRMQVPDISNANNLNGVRVELANNQCFVITTTNSNTVNQWQWVQSDATNSAVGHVTGTLQEGTTSLKVFGLKDGVKVDKVILLPQVSTCIPSNDFSSGQPGENCNVPAPTVTIAPLVSNIPSGTSTTITWSSTNALSCAASGSWVGTKAISGMQSTGNLTTSQTYTLTCTGVNGTTSATTSVGVSVPPTAPTMTLGVSPTVVVSGSTSTISWSSTNATFCSASGSWSGNKATTGSETTASLTSNQTYTLSCTGPGGSVQASAGVNVTTPQPAPTVTLTANPTSISSGSASLLTWTSSNATSCTSGGAWTGGRSSSGSLTTGSLTASKTYSLTCSGAGGSATASVTVSVTALPTTKVGDLNGDNAVGFSDLAILLSSYGKSVTGPNKGDFTNDGSVTFADLAILLSNYGK